MIQSGAISDFQRVKFLFKMAEETRGAHGLLVSPWEQNFLANFTASNRPSLWFTPGRRVSTDKMWMLHGADIGMPWPAPETSSAAAPDAQPGCCQFLVREDGRQQPCNAPAAMVRQNGFRYCESHAEAIQRDLQRRGKTMILLPFKS